MKHYQGYLVDLDGTMYKGEAAVDGASHFIDHLIGLQVPFLFLTNNSSRTQDQIAAKLNKLGVKAQPDQVYTSSLATADFIKEKKEQARVYVIGEEGLHKALTDRGHTLVEEEADFVVIGIDREISYSKLARACLEVRKGAGFVSTNSDTAIPTDKGMLPGNGAMTSVVAVSTGVDPIFVGKPEPIIMERALKELQLQADHVLMVGDNYHTDILAGMKAGVDTLMVETGLSSFHEIEAHTHQPTYKMLNLHEWLVELKE